MRSRVRFGFTARGQDLRAEKRPPAAFKRRGLADDGLETGRLLIDCRAPMDAPVWIERNETLVPLLAQIEEAEVFAVDTESNSMYAYFERVCLVQVSVAGIDALIDPLAVDLQPLLDLLTDGRRQKILHGADYDILCLKRQYGCRMTNLFDTGIAARVLGWERVGLAAIIESVFGVKLDKRYQRYDWGRRPLDDRACSYARLDTHFLLELRDQQLTELQARERIDLFEHACVRQCGVEPRPRMFDPTGYRRISGAKALDADARRVLAALWSYREQEARRRDRPPFRVFDDATLLTLAREQPSCQADLHDVRGIPRTLSTRDRGRLLECVATAPDEPQLAQRPINPPKDERDRYQSLRTWRTRYAEREELVPDIIVSKSVLLAVAHANPTCVEDLAGVTEMDDWERQRYGQDLVEALGRTP